MAALEQPPRYNESFSEFEVPSYSASLQQLQNLPPPINEEPSLMDAPSHQVPSYAYDLRPATNTLPVSSSELTPPPYEQSLNEEPIDGAPSQGSANNNMMGQNGSAGFNGYQNGEVEDKIKDILSRYNPHAENVPKMEDSFPSPPQNQPIRQVQQMPRQQQPQVQTPQVHSQPVYQPPQQATQYQAPQQIHSYQPQPDQQLRARVVQNVPSQQIQSPPPVQKFQHQVHQQQTPPPQMHRPAPQLQQPAHQMQQQQQQAVPQQAMPHYPQQGMPQQTMPQQTMPQQAMPQQVMPQQAMPQQVMPQQVMPQQVYQQPVQQTQGQQMNQTDAPYLQLLQQQAMQFQMQNQQIQQLQSYFDKISTFMERTEKRITNLETTAQGILKNQKQDDITSVVSSSEIEVLKRMQHQMESDFDIAKKMQAEFEREKRKEEKRRSKSSSSSTPSPSSSRSKDKRDSKVSSSSSSMQECPICTLKVPFGELELHVNQCLEGIEKSDTKPDPVVQEKASFWKRVFGPGPKKDKEEPSNQIVPVAKPPTVGRPALPAPVSTNSLGQPPMYPNAQDFYQMPFVYRGGYPQPQMMPYGYPQPQQIYYYPPNMAQPTTQAKK